MAGDKSNSASNCMRRDTAAEDDSLGFKPYVEAIAEFLTNEDTLAPITLSIEGQWGCGKSSFMQQLKKKIEEGNDRKSKRKRYFTVWFNCWRYEKEDELWAAFALNLMEKLSEQLSWRGRQWAKINLVWLRLKFKWKNESSIILHILSRVIFILIILALWASFILSIPHLMERLFSYSMGISFSVSPFTGPIDLFLNLVNPSNSTSSIDANLVNNSTSVGLVDAKFRTSVNVLLMLAGIIGLLLQSFYLIKEIKNFVGNPFDFSEFISNPNYTAHISFIEHFHSDFDKIIESYVGNSRVYVFVDDLDRCEVPKAAELMQALNLMISDKANVYFSIGIDRKVISAGLAAKNEKVLGYLGVKGLKYGYDYIEKFIQLPFKVPSPKNEDFKEFMNPQKKQDPPSKKSWLSDNPLSNNLKKVFSKFKITHSGSQTDEESIPQESTESAKTEEGVPEGTAKEEPEKEEKILNDKDCDEKSGEWDHILEMVAPALDRNPRRMKQFFNLFRFQRTIGKRTELLSYDPGTNPENRWNCRKLAKFVAISMNWPSLISALSSNSELLNQLQAYALDPKGENKNLEEWTKDEKLIRLLKYGCVEEGNLSEEKANYTLSGLDFSKLLQISPVVEPPDENLSSSLSDMEFVRISAGDFMMGSPDGEDGRRDNEGPVHKVTIKNLFYLGKYPVTQKQWKKVMGNNPSRFKGDTLPVESVSWNDVQEFIKKLNKMEGTDKYRLPSEAEWEYACRAGTTTNFYFGDDESKLGDYAWYTGNSGGKIHPVGEKNHNSWNLYDMHGNVWEWVQDRWHDNYEGAPSDGSAWENGNGSYRVVRGGGWHYGSMNCRSAIRNGLDLDNRDNNVGFRLLRKP
ncbi:serine/threonine kinase [Methanosarcina sp. MTP4]|uniref:SUMF1/EgtB/PvdO family nonheme iron enzyme n=1 Tax=Methanosarcina sp. MTP4 TaxID=1434100 RepID=UPI00061580F8|nr:SUMF1/EgtB/PvdO family nonheme iron enzyme [Methanosarcina sp. MTP4]AKB23787.1 serine/threonine kinase [Methanosarcina sp. MTP4]